MDEKDERDRVYDPMIYDIMRETANQIIANYLAWEREAATVDEAGHWRSERFRTRLEIRAVDPDSRRAVEAKTAELREVLSRMPEHAPAVA